MPWPDPASSLLCSQAGQGFLHPPATQLWQRGEQVQCVGPLPTALTCLGLSFPLCKTRLTMKPFVGLLVKIPQIKHAGRRPGQVVLTALQLWLLLC